MNVGLGRVVVYVAAVALVVLAMVGAATVAVLATDRGTALAAAAIRHQFPDMLDFAHVEGNLVDGLRVEGLRLATPAAHLAVATLEWHWRPRALLAGWLEIERLALDDVTVDVLPAETPAEPSTPRLPRLPLVVRLRALEVTALSVHDEEERLEIARLAATLNLTARRLDVIDLSVEHADARLHATATFEDGRRPTVQLRLAVQAPVLAPDLALRVEVAGPLQAMLIKGELTGPVQAAFNGTLDPLAVEPHASLGVELAELAVGAATAPHRIGPLRIAVRGTPLALRFELQGPLTLHGMGSRDAALSADIVREPSTGRVTSEFSWHLEASADRALPALTGTGHAHYADAVVALRHVTAGPYPSTLTAEVRDLATQPRLAADLTAGGVSLPLGDDGARIAIDALDLRADGTRERLQLEGSVQAREARLGPLALQVAGIVEDMATLRFRSFAGKLLDGTFSGAGDLRFTPVLDGAFDVELRALDLAPLVADLDTRLDAVLALGVRTVAAGLAAEIRLSRLGGTWRGERVTGRARLAYDAPARYTIDGLTLALGDNQLLLSATLDERLNGRFELAAPALAALAPGLRGRLDAQGVLSGSAQTPALAAVFGGTGLGFATWSVARVDGHVDLDAGRASDQRLDIVLDDVRNAARHYGRLTAQLAGRLDEHALEVRLEEDGGHERVRVHLSGAWTDAAWRGTLDTFGLDWPPFGRWQLQRATALGYAADALQLAPACLVEASGAAFCVRVPGWSSLAGSAVLSLTSLPLGHFGDLLPATLGITGLLDAEASIAQEGELRQARGRVQVNGGALEVRLDDAVETLAVTAANADFTVANDALAATLQLAVDRWLEVDGTLALGLDDDAKLQAEVRTTAKTLDWIEQFLPDLAGSRGAAKLRLQASGSLAAPHLSFDAVLDEGSLFIQPSGLRLSTLRLAGRMAGAHELLFDGSFGNADGVATVGGAVTLDAAAGWPGYVTIRGERVPAVRLPEAEADLAPDLRISFGPDGVDLSGSLGLPRVKIDIKQLPESAVAVSQDEVIIGPERIETEEESRFDYFVDAVTGRVDLTLGDDVWITAAGLRARLTGALRWTKTRGQRVGRGEGRVSIAEGGYKAYGQNLGIERGHLTFAGAIDNPALDVRAVRRDIDIVAGVMVTGDVRRPKFDLFSEPALPDSDILSYIITGRALDNASSGDAGMIARAALSLGAERSSMVTSRVQDAFGLDELSINTGTTAEQTSLSAGKRLTPKLSVRSEFNPFDRLWSFFLNYKLTEQWSVEGESGARQGADVIYSIEREELLPPGWWGDD